MKVITLTPTDKPAQPVFVGDDTPTTPAQQVTINHLSEGNLRWPRNIQLTTDFVLIKRAGCPTTGIHVDDLIKLCAQAEPAISWPPLFKQNIVTQGSPAIIESQFEAFNPELTSDGNKVYFKWQQGDNQQVNWSDIQDSELFSGCLTNTLTINNKPGNKALVLRCVATNAAGSRASDVVVSSSPQIRPVTKA